MTLGFVATLLLGVLSVSMMFSYIKGVWTMDEGFSRKDDCYMMAFRHSPESPAVGNHASEFLNLRYQDYPGIEAVTFVYAMNPDKDTVRIHEKHVKPVIMVADSQFFKVFDVELLVGNRNLAFTQPRSVVLSERFARNVFGKANPLGESVQIGGEEHTVVGVSKAFSTRSSLDYDVLVSAPANNTNGSYLLGKAGVEFLLTNEGFDKAVFDDYLVKASKTLQLTMDGSVHLVPFTDAFVKMDHHGSYGTNYMLVMRDDEREKAYLLVSILLVVLLISLLNFGTLQRLQCLTHDKSIRIRQFVGATLKDVTRLYTRESLVLFALVDLVAILLFLVLLPWVNQVSAFKLYPTWLEAGLTISGVLGLFFIVGWVVRRYTIRAIFVTGEASEAYYKKGWFIRRSALVVQCLLSVLLINISLVVWLQVSMMINKDIGMDTEGVIRTNLPDWTYDDLKNNPYIEASSFGFSPFEPALETFHVVGQDNTVTAVYGLMVEPGYLDVFDMKLLQGRFFDDTHEIRPHEYARVVINEAARKKWHLEDISSVRLSWRYGSAELQYEVVGVVKDFDYQHLSVRPKPLIMIYISDMGQDLFVRFKKGMETEGMASLKELYEKSNQSDAVFRYTYVADEREAMYREEKQLGWMCLCFTLVGLMITAIGLFVLVYHDTRQRVKEIGIRKVNGAPVASIMWLLLANVLKSMGLAVVLASPLAWILMNRWLSSFAYKIPLSGWIFALSGIIALVIALLTVGILSWKAATNNPVESLRDE